MSGLPLVWACPFAGETDVRSVESGPGPAACAFAEDGVEMPMTLPVSGVFAGQSVARAKSALSGRNMRKPTYLAVTTRISLYNRRVEAWSSKHRLVALHPSDRRSLHCSGTVGFARRVLSLRLQSSSSLYLAFPRVTKA